MPILRLYSIVKPSFGNLLCEVAATYFLQTFYRGRNMLFAYIHQLDDLILGRYKKKQFNTALLIFQFGLCLPFGLLIFFVQFFFQIYSWLSKNGYPLKGSVLPCVPVFPSRVSFYLTPLPTAFEKVSSGTFDPYF